MISIVNTECHVPKTFSDLAKIAAWGRLGHIGTEKTGTSYIQRFLSDNRAILAEKGILYPIVDDSENHSMLAWHCADSQHRPPSYSLKTGSAYFDRLKKCIDEADQNAIIVLSSEHFHSRCWGDAIGLLKARLWTLKLDAAAIILYLRDQASLAISSYSTAVLSGHTEDFQIADITPKNYYFNYQLACDQWAEVFSKDIIRIRPYNSIKSKNIIDDFFKCMGLSNSFIQEIKSECKFPLERIHSRINAPMIDIIKSMSLLKISRTNNFINIIKNTELYSDYSYLDISDVVFIKTLFDPINKNVCKKFNLDEDLFPSVSQHETMAAHTKGKGQIITADVLKVTAKIWEHMMVFD